MIGGTTWNETFQSVVNVGREESEIADGGYAPSVAASGGSDAPVSWMLSRSLGDGGEEVAGAVHGDTALGVVLQARRANVPSDREAALSARTTEVQELVCAPQWSWDCGWAIAVVGCESSWNPVAVNGSYLGLFQIWLGHLRPGGILEGMMEIELLAAEGNIRAAHAVYKVLGPGAWPGCSVKT